MFANCLAIGKMLILQFEYTRVLPYFNHTPWKIDKPFRNAKNPEVLFIDRERRQLQNDKTKYKVSLC